MVDYRSRKDGSHYPLSRRVKTGTMSKGTVHLSVPKRLKSKSGFAVSLLDSNGTRRFQHTGFSTEKPNGTIKFFITEKEAQHYIDSMTLMTQKAYEPKIVDLSHGAIPKKEQELRDAQLKRYAERSPEEVAKSKQQITEIERNVEKDMQKHELGTMMKEAKNLRDRGDILNARMLESMQRSGTKAIRKSSDDYMIERNGYRLKFDKGASIKSSVRFWSKAQAENYINGEMVQALEKGDVSWRKIE